MSKSKSAKRIIIVGAGLGGCLIGILLAKKGYKVLVIEKRRDPRTNNKHEGRSINMTLSMRGIKALGEVFLLNKILPQAIPLKGRMIHGLDGGLVAQRYGKNEHEVLFSIKRHDINIALLNSLNSYKNVVVRFNEVCEDINVDKVIVKSKNQSSGKIFEIRGKLIIGADGAGSMIRKKINRLGVIKETMEWGYKEVILPSIDAEGEDTQQKSLHIWPRERGLLLALPNIDRSFTCTWVLPFKGKGSFQSLKTAKQIRPFLLRYYPDVAQHADHLVNDFLKNPIGSFVTIRTPNWYFKDKVVLLGDSVHAVFPFYGQGMNSTFEDCVTLVSCMKKYPRKWERAFCEYQRLRKLHTDTLSHLSSSNFYELRDGVSSLRLVAKREVDILLNKIFPFWLPLYTMIAHTSIPYADAVARAKIQDRIGGFLGLHLLVEIKAMQLLLRKRFHRNS